MKKVKHRSSKDRRKKSQKNSPKTKNRKYVWLNVLPDDKWIRVKSGITVYEALQNTDLELDGECGGDGTCGKCRIHVITALRQPDEQEKKLLSPESLAKGERLACRTRIRKTIVIHTDTTPNETELFQILKHSHEPEIELNPLLDRYSVDVLPPSLSHPTSDLSRLKVAIGWQRSVLNITWECLASLYQDLRRSQFKGKALIHQDTLLAWKSPVSIAGQYGMVFDIGTTTLVGKLIDMNNGQEIRVVSRLNSQSRYGSDVISRIKYVKENKRGLKRMRELLLKDINLITRRLLQADQIEGEDVFIALAAGNTTMQHFLLGVDPSGIATAPFSPVITEGVTLPAKDLGIAIHPDAVFHIMPAKSGYIGGDLVSFILSSGALESDTKLVLGFDFGTNGEIFLGNGKRMLTCSAAAGPALEGARISQGMIARAGAIESVWVEENHLRYNIVGNIKAKGVCGSGLVDLVAVLLHHGVIDKEGLLNPSGLVSHDDLFGPRIILNAEGEAHDFVVAWEHESDNGQRILLTQKDVRELQLAKGAVAAGVEILMEQMGVKFEDVDEICLSGALGNYVKPLSAMRIGLIPNITLDKIISVGNAASAGAKMALLSKSHWIKAAEIVDHLEHVELSTQSNFYHHFIEDMNFPVENLW